MKKKNSNTTTHLTLEDYQRIETFLKFACDDQHDIFDLIKTRCGDKDIRTKLMARIINDLGALRMYSKSISELDMPHPLDYDSEERNNWERLFSDVKCMMTEGYYKNKGIN